MRLDRSVSNVLRVCAAALLMTLVVPPSAAALAQSSPAEIHVAVAVFPPFIMEQNGSLTGFSVELWEAIAARLKMKTSYQIVPGSKALEEVLRSKAADITIVPVLITLARDEIFDFSLPIMQSGFQVMVRDTGEPNTTNPLEALLLLLFSKTTLVWLGIASLLVLIPAHLIWLFERRRKDGIISDTNYFPGIFEAMYWAVSCLTAQAETMPHQWVARLFSVFWMFAGVVFVAFYTAQLTTTLTIQQIQGAISGPDDLPGKRVATIEHSVAADYLRAHNAQLSEFERPAQMFQALLNKRVDAVVFSAPVLLYYASHEGKGLVKTVRPEFNTGPVAILVQLDSPLRRRINGALLALRENGTYDQIYNKWFGSP